MEADQVVLTIPPDPRHAATARVVAASLAADAGFDIDDIDDLRLAVNEAVAVVTDDPDQPTEAMLTITFTTEPGRLEVVIVHSSPATSFEVDELATTILDAVVDSHEVHADGLRLIKSATPAP